jgi:hypothetical protein
MRRAIFRANPRRGGQDRRRLRYTERLIRGFTTYWQEHGCPWPIPSALVLGLGYSRCGLHARCSGQQNEHSICQACRSNRRRDDFRVGASAAEWREIARSEDRRGGRFSFSVSLDSCRKELSEQRFDPHTLPESWGVPTADVRGNITSHRGRSTIASQLFNAKEPMTLFELQEWLGHSTPAATQHYMPRSRQPSSRSPTLTLATSRGTFARLEYSLTRKSSETGGLPASPGSSTIWGTATAPMISLSSAHIGWPAPSATSTCRKTPPLLCCSKAENT